MSLLLALFEPVVAVVAVTLAPLAPAAQGTLAIPATAAFTLSPLAVNAAGYWGSPWPLGPGLVAVTPPPLAEARVSTPPAREVAVAAPPLPCALVTTPPAREVAVTPPPEAAVVVTTGASMSYDIYLGDAGTIDVQILSGGAALNLSDATSVEILFERASIGPPATVRTCTVTNAAVGQVTYAWQPGDLTSEGTWHVRWRVNKADGSRRTYPTASPYVVTVAPAM